MKAKLIKTESGYNLFTQGFLKASTETDLINQMNIEEGNIRYHLSKQNCDEIFGVVDLDDLAIQSDFKNGSVDGISFKLGFNKAMELNKDKVFTLEDVRKAFSFYAERAIVDMKFLDDDFVEFIKSLQQPTEIEVEIVTTTRMENGKSGIDTPTIKPKLDSEGCLILKKI
jgi:hypothetical protein